MYVHPTRAQLCSSTLVKEGKGSGSRGHMAVYRDHQRVSSSKSHISFGIAASISRNSNGYQRSFLLTIYRIDCISFKIGSSEDYPSPPLSPVDYVASVLIHAIRQWFVLYFSSLHFGLCIKQFTAFFVRLAAMKDRSTTATCRGLHSTVKHATKVVISIPLGGVIIVNVFPHLLYSYLQTTLRTLSLRGTTFRWRNYARNWELYTPIA